MLFEKRHNMPPYLAEIPYGFKNLWRITATMIDSVNKTIAEENITSVSLNGSDVTVAQLNALYDWNRDACAVTEENGNGIYVTLSGFDKENAILYYDLLLAQNVEINGVLSVSGDMVDNSTPSAPVINHDDTKLDKTTYNAAVPNLVSNVTTLMNTVNTQTQSIAALEGSAVKSASVNGGTTVYPDASGNLDLQIDGMTAEQINTALNTKINQNVTSTGTLTQNVTMAMNNQTGVLSYNVASVNVSSGSASYYSNSFDLKSILGINDLEAIDNQYTYFVDDGLISGYDSLVTVQLSNLYRYKDDGTKYNPTSTDGVQTIISLVSDYSGINIERKKMIAAIGVKTSATAAAVTASFANFRKYEKYNQYNSYRVGTIVYDSATKAMYEVIQAITRPVSALSIIPVTNSNYYSPTVDKSIIAPMSFFANLDDSANPGTAYDVDEARTAMMKGSSRTYAGYADYVEFASSTIPAQITTEGTWNTYISLWVTDGIIFNSLADLLEYLNLFSSPMRYKMSNLGIVATQYENGGISLTQKFGISSISSGLSSIYMPLVGGATTGDIAVFSAGGVVSDSGKSASDFATAAQGAKADSAVQSVSVAPGSSNGKIKLTVDGNDSEASITGLGTAAYTNSTAYATAAQGAKADSAVQSVSLASGTNNGTLKITVNGSETDNVAVKGLGSAAYAASSAFATAAQGAKADSALQAADVVDNLSSTSGTAPLSANQGRVLQQQINSISAGGKPIGGFATYADRYTNTSQFASDLQPIQVQDYIYIAADENHTGSPAQYAVAAISGSGVITYTFIKLVPDTARDFNLSPIQSTELGDNTVTTSKIVDSAVTTAKIADNAITSTKLSTALQTAIASIDDAIISPVSSSGSGNVVTGVSVDASNALQISLGNVLDGVSSSGSGNAVASIAKSGTDVVATLVTLLQSIAKSGSGNALTGVSTDSNGNVTLSSDTLLASVTTSGSGNVLTGISASGGVITATKGTMISSLPDASTAQKGIVQLNDNLTSTSTTLALTANQGKVLQGNISALDAAVVHLANSETITGTKTFAAHPVVPSKTTLPSSPSSTQYATESQVNTRYGKVSDAVANNLVGFGTNGALIDTGIPYSSVNAIEITAATQTTLTGIIKGNGTVLSAAVADTDYVSAAHLTDSSAHSSLFSGKQNTITANGVLQGNGSGVVTAKTVDTTPTSNSTNLITSGAVYAAIIGAIEGSY